MLNTVSIIGRVAYDIELKHTSQGISVCSFTLVNEAGYGEKKITSFFQVVAWRNLAENFSRYCGKGSLVAVTGQLQSREFDDKDGGKKRIVEIVANDIQFLTKKEQTQESDQNGFPPAEDFFG